MERAPGLISSLLDVASPRDMPFHQPQYVQYTYHGLIFVPSAPVLFADNARCGFVIARYGFLVIAIFQSGLNSLQRLFLHFGLYVTLCNEQTTATNEAQWPPHFSVCDWLLGHALRLSLHFTLIFRSNWIHAEKFLCTFVTLCNESV